jgi:hypothetical protein
MNIGNPELSTGMRTQHIDLILMIKLARKYEKACDDLTDRD